MSDPWRYRCPEGHTSIEVESSREGIYRCRSCQQLYEQLLDVQTDKLVDSTRGRTT